MKKINITTTAAIFTVLFTGFYLTSCASTAPSEPKPELGFNNEDEEENIEVEKIVAVHNPLPDGEIILLDSFEDGNFWQPWSDIDEKNSSSQTEVTAAWSSEGENGGVWFFEKTSRGENAVFYCDALSYRSWGNAKKILADINNTTNSSLKIHLVIETESHTFFTKGASIGVGENQNIYFDISDLSDELGTSAKNSDSIYRAKFQIAGRLPEGKIFIDNIRLVK